MCLEAGAEATSLLGQSGFGMVTLSINYYTE